MERADLETGLTIKPAERCRWDLVSLGEVMLRFDPGDRRVWTTRQFEVSEGGGEYNVARGLKRCFGLESAIVTAIVDNPVGRLLQDLIYQGGVDQSLIRWVEFDGVGRAARNGLNFTDNPHLQAPRLARLVHQERISVLAAVPRVLELMRGWLEGEFPGLTESLAAARGQSIGKRWWRFRAVHRRLGFKFWAFVSGGATLPADLESFWTTIGFALIQGYGMTETTALVTLNHPFKIARGSIGKPLAGREVQIGADGEILVRGDSIASQVWQHGGLQAREPGWLATGDLATRNAQGELIFAGRKSDVIVTSAGLNIHPQDLEAVLRRQPGVQDCLVVAYDSAAGPTPAAVLIPQGQATICKVRWMLPTASWRHSSRFATGCAGRSRSIPAPPPARSCGGRCRAGRSSRCRREPMLPGPHRPVDRGVAPIGRGETGGGGERPFGRGPAPG